MFSRSEVVRVSLAYRYCRPEDTDQKNEAVYGASFNREGIGGNFEVWLRRDRESLSDLRLITSESFFDSLKARVKKELDHRCLFEVEPYFASRPATLENIAVFMLERLPEISSLRIDENEDWSVEISRNNLRLYYRFMFEACRVELAVEGQLQAESGLLLPRNELLAAVKSWTQVLNLNEKPLLIFNSLKSFLPGLVHLRVEGPKNWALGFE